MQLNKHLEFFNPITDLNGDIHVIGCGAMGSLLLEMFARLGVPKLHIYDFDVVQPHNIANQMFFHDHIGDTKENALFDILGAINPDLKVIPHGKYVKQLLSGYIFLCVDNIDLRREITEAQMYNPYIKAFFDFRMRLTDAQHYGADWSNEVHREAFIGSMQFTHEEAKEATPVSACNTTLSIAPTIRTIVSLGVANFINLVKTGDVKKLILIDAFQFTLDAF